MAQKYETVLKVEYWGREVAKNLVIYSEHEKQNNLIKFFNKCFLL